MQDVLSITAFRFACAFCEHRNEYRHQHPSQVRPFLVSTRCVSCQKMNTFQSLPGTIVESPDAVEIVNSGSVRLVQITRRLES